MSWLLQFMNHIKNLGYGRLTIVTKNIDSNKYLIKIHVLLIPY